MDEQTVRLLLRLTARVSCALFLLGFAGRAAGKLSPSRWARWLHRSKGEAFMALAWSHSLHLLWIVVGLVVTQGTLVRGGWVTGVFGGLGFACIYALAVLSLRSTANWSGRVPIERFAVYYVWLIFFLAMAAGARRSAGHALVAALLLGAFIANVCAGSHASSHRRGELATLPEASTSAASKAS